jgi:hypothetical protein
MESNEGTKVRRGLFGVRPADVERLLADREQASRVAAAQVQAAEERAVAMQQRATTLEERASALETQLTESLREREQLEQQLATQPPPAPAEPALPLGVLTQEMARVLNATQEAGSRILARTKNDVERHLEDIERRRHATDEDRARLASWASDADGSLADLHERLVATHDAIQHLRTSVEDAVGSTRSAMSSLEQQLDQVAALITQFQQAQAVRIEEAGPAEPTHDDAPAAHVQVEHAAEQAGPPAPIALDAPAPPVSVAAAPPGPGADQGPDRNGGAASEDLFDRAAIAEGFPSVVGQPYDPGRIIPVLTPAAREDSAPDS